MDSKFLHWFFPGLKDFDPSQPRDESGQWSETGADGESGGDKDTERNKPKGTGDPNKNYSVVTETHQDDADIIIAQGIDPTFKPIIPGVTEFAPGRGAEREGTYVSNENAFSKGSYGNIRINLEVSGDQLKSPEEMTQLGREDVDDVLNTENGAVTVGEIPNKQIRSVEVYDPIKKKWDKMSRDEYLNRRGIPTNIPKLPSVKKYQDWLRGNQKKFRLSDRQVEDQIHSYNRGNLSEKIQYANETGLVDIPEKVMEWALENE